MNKKTTFVLLLTLLAVLLYGNTPSGIQMLSVNIMLNKYGFQGGKFSASSQIVNDVDFMSHIEFGAIEEGASIDTPEEFITATYFSPIEVQCAQARLQIEQVLPQNNKIEAGIKLGAMWYQKMVAYQFAAPAGSDKSEQLARYDLIMKTISERTGATRIQMVNAFRAGVRAVIAETVKAQFNTISFVADTAGLAYNIVLQRDNENGYKMSYTGFFDDDMSKMQTKEISGSSLNQLISRMNQSSDFNPTIIGVIRQEATKIPAILYANWQAKGYKADPLELITRDITNFYLNPNQTTWNRLLGIQCLLDQNRTQDNYISRAAINMIHLMKKLSPVLGSFFDNEAVKVYFNPGWNEFFRQNPLPAEYNSLVGNYF